MATLTPFDDTPKASQRLPWMALVIIAFATLIVGWIVFTTTPAPAVAHDADEIGQVQPLVSTNQSVPQQ